MKITIELVKPTGNTKHVLELPRPYKGPRVLEQIDKLVVKQFAADKDWTRWNLIDMKD
jgi:hypothetical protein